MDSYYPLENEPGDETLMMGDGYDEDDYDNDYDDDEEEGRSRQPQDWHFFSVRLYVAFVGRRLPLQKVPFNSLKRMW